MSAESSGSSRPPESNSALAGSEAETADSVSRSDAKLEELPDPADRVREFLDEMGERAHLPLSSTHGRALRAECVEEERDTFEYDVYDERTDEEGNTEWEVVGTEEEEEVVKREARPVWQGVAEMLDWEQDYLRSALRLEYGTESDPSHEILDVPLENSWMAAYQDQERAKLKALERKTCGFETCEECETRWCEEPDEHETDHVAGAFEEPVVVLTSRTAAGAGRPPVDHAREIAEAWTGPNGNDGVARSLRYVLDERLGLGSDDWVRWTQGEPHTGKRTGEGYGGNTGYHHAHDVVILDGAVAAESVGPATFRTVIESHVEKCEHAGGEAHDLQRDWKENPEGVESVSVKHVEEGIEESVASYAASYLSNESEDLLERSPEYLMWAATMWATGTQKGIKSDSANHAIAADRCDHKHTDEEQDMAHGESVRRSPCRCAEAPWGPGCSRCDGRGYHVVCMMCGSPWEIDQSQTLTAHRTADGSHATAADGGGKVPPVERAGQAVEEELRSAWPSAREAASVGGPTAVRGCDHAEPDTCPLCATETESPDHTVPGDTPIPESACAPSEPVSWLAGFRRPPSWKAKAVIRDGEELPASGGTVDKRPLDLPSAPVRVVAMATRAAGSMVCQSCKVTYRTVGGYVEHGCGGGRVHVAWDAPTDPPADETTLSRSEFVETVPDRLMGSGDGCNAEQTDTQADEFGREQIERYVERRPEATVAQVLGAVGLGPVARSVVEEVLAE